MNMLVRAQSGPRNKEQKQLRVAAPSCPVETPSREPQAEESPALDDPPAAHGLLLEHILTGRLLSPDLVFMLVQSGNLPLSGALPWFKPDMRRRPGYHRVAHGSRTLALRYGARSASRKGSHRSTRWTGEPRLLRFDSAYPLRIFPYVSILLAELPASTPETTAGLHERKTSLGEPAAG